jgi:ABC-type dipeptide/oligopeptide/nickel transport system ATPase component
VRAVDEVSLRITPARRWASSASPVPASTLALTILRLLPTARIAGGRMLFEGEDLLKKSEFEMRAARQTHRHDPAGSHGLR